MVETVAKDAVVCVIRTAQTNDVTFHSRLPPTDGTGTLKIPFRAIEPAYADQFPAVFCRVSKIDLKAVSLQVNIDGWTAL